MPYEKSGYVLYAREQPLKKGRTQTIYFFAKREPVVGKSIILPEGYLVAVDRRTGVPYLKKK